MTKEDLIEALERGETGQELNETVGDIVYPQRVKDRRSFKFVNHALPYVNSVDAALSLLREVLPGWVGYLTLEKVNYAVVGLGGVAFEAYAPTPAAALVAAILKAKE